MAEKSKKSPENTIDVIKKRQFANIVSKIREGKSITSTEQKFLDEYERNAATEPVSAIDEESVARTADLVEFLGITAQRIAELAKDGVIVKKDHGRYYAAKSIRNYIRMLQKGRKSKHGGAATMEELRQRLIDEQGRKEAAIASLRELELKMKAESLIPESQAAEMLLQILTPLRRLLDAFPREVSAQANPADPVVAEEAIRKSMDQRIFAQIIKILDGD